ncbi:tape measure protein [Klebsiella pneumoniae]|uniref:tape measure protein n=2 Tax=Klebsiella pneumoniae TaxID=573 RepID=UPI0021DAAC75|nr:tape measure protein [Klebsiella pneumoniae]MCU8675355.1 tape measure protein [Klebsiella pneumoniae]MCU8687421.1 tape measure protein [Klebsiella pneumoniae]HDY7037062.1 tape measure protein [Klebsiella pneumoniae]
MANYTVDEFIIQLGFNENVSKNLQRLESRTLKVAERIEKNLNRAFTPKGNFNGVIQSANNASKQINRAFSKSMNFDEAGKSSVKSVENAAKASAKRIKDMYQDAYGNRGKGHPPAGKPQGRGSDLTAANSIRSLANTQFYSNLTRRLESMGSTGQARAMKLRQQIHGLRDDALANPSASLNQFRLALRAATDSASKWASQNRKQVSNADGLSSSFSRLVSVSAALYGTFEAVRKVVETGVAREGVNLSAEAVFKGQAGDAKTFAAQFSDQIGQGVTETLKQYTGFAAGAQNSLGYQGTQDFYKNAAVFGRIRGLDAEQLKGIMTAFTQMASKGRVQAEELRGQLGDRLPGAEQMFADALGVNTQQLDKLMQNGKLLSKDVLPRVSAQMKKMADEAGGLDRVSQMAVTGIGRVKAAMENDLNKAFTSSEKGLGQFNASVANMLNDASPIAEALGHILGKVASMTSGAVDHVDEWSRKLSALILRTSAWYDDLSDGQKKLVDSAEQFAIGAAGVLALVKSIAGVANKLKWLSALLGGGAEAGAGAGGLLKGASRLAGPVGVALVAHDAVDASGVEQKYPTALGVDNPIAKALNWLSSPSKVLGAQDGDSITNSPFTRAMGSLGDWLQGNNALNGQANTFDVPSMYNPAQTTIRNDQRINISVNMDSQKIGTFQTQVLTGGFEDLNINAEHLGD